MNVGERVAEILRAIDAPILFGVPGGQTLPLYQATRVSGMAHVMMRDERNAACAADAYARISGRIGVCDATVGPGVTNLASGLAESLASSIPVLAIVADIRTDQQHLRRRSVVSQAFDQLTMLNSVTKWVSRVERARSIDDAMDQALRVATTGRPGPVALEIPEDLWLEEAAATRPFSPADGVAPRHRGAPDADVLALAARALAAAARPVVLSGGGVIAAGASAELRRLVQEQRLPVVTTVNGKGAVDEYDELAMGVVGLFGKPRAVRVLDDADVVLVVGSKLDQFSTHGWRIPRADQTVIHVDVDGEELGRVGPAAVAVAGDARSTLRALRLLLAEETPAPRGAWPPPYRPVPRAAATGGLHPADVCERIDARLTATDVVVCDASYSSGWASAHVRLREPNRFAAPRGLAGIGWSGGAAIGARLATAADGRVYVIAGDGGWAYGVAELETAARLGLDITYLVLNNSAYGWIVDGERKMEMADRSTFSDVDFAVVANGFGAEGHRVTTLDEVDEALAAASVSKGPQVIDVVTSSTVSPVVSLRGARALELENGAAVAAAQDDAADLQESPRRNHGSRRTAH